MNDRIIAHVDLDAFFASVEQVLNPDLLGQAVVVGGRSMDRGVVSSASYEARTFGVRSAMPLRQARRLCPHAHFVPGNYHAYEEFSDEVFEICGRYTPLIEQAGIDEGYLDLTGTQRVHLRETSAPANSAPPRDWPLVVAERLRGDVRRQTGLSISVGLAANKLVAKIAANQAKPDGTWFVPPGQERAFLSPKPLGVIPGLGPRAVDALGAKGIRTVGELADTPAELLDKCLGPAAAQALLAKAMGCCDDAVCPHRDPVSIGHETTFDADTADRAFLHATLDHLARRACWRLRKEALAARTVTVKLRYRGFQTLTCSSSLDHATDHDDEVSGAALRLLDRAYTRSAPVRLVGVRLTGLTELRGRQLGLFTEPLFEKRCRVYRVADRIRDRFGARALAAGRSIELMCWDR
jgi:DNA polymerase-4